MWARARFSHPDTPAACKSAHQPSRGCGGGARLTQARGHWQQALQDGGHVGRTGTQAPVSLPGETEEADLRKQPERPCRGLCAERSNFKGMGSPVPPSLSHRVHVHPSPGFCLTLHRPPG